MALFPGIYFPGNISSNILGCAHQDLYKMPLGKDVTEIYKSLCPFMAISICPSSSLQHLLASIRYKQAASFQ